ncbi:MAG: hypothetical protein GY904_03875 [Planctomycetaceae bacterium]|nr:hypothetical protein [Planctomycetaceae bacterium]
MQLLLQNSLLHHLQWSLVLGISLGVMGCDLKRDRPPGPVTSSAVVQGVGNVTHLDWQEEGLTVTLIDQMDHHALNGTSASGEPFYQYSGVATSGDGRRYQWDMEASDGKTAALTIAGKVYDLDNGRVLTVVVGGEDVVVHQAKYEVPRRESSPTDWADFFAVHPDVVEPLISETTTRDERSE